MSPLTSWTIHVVRRDGLESHTVDVHRGRLLLLIVSVGLVLTAVGIAGGLWWASRSESDAITGLESEIAVLRAERAQVRELAGRLAEVEDRFGVLQDAVTDGRQGVPPTTSVPVGGSPPLVSRPELEATSLAWPLVQRGFVTRNFGSRAETAREGHTGLDIAVPTGSYVRAIQSGRVEEAGEDSVYGRFLRIAHADGLTSLYGHNSWLFAAAGDMVDRLQVIALSGNTGRSSAPHLHLELARDGSLFDPLTAVTDDNVRGGGDARDGTEPR